MFENYIGQDHIKKFLSNLILYHKSSQEPMQHMLITGASGCGKTHLVNEIAKSLGTKCVTILATNTSEDDLVKAICSLDNKDILFIDEIHSLNKKFVEMLFTVISEHTLHTEYNGCIQKFKLNNNFTIIGATDRPGLLNPALLNRFKVTLTLKQYSQKELEQLVKLHTKNISISDDLCIQITKLCKYVPRILLNIIDNIKTYLNSLNKTRLETEDLDTIKEFLDIDSLGLDSIDLAILNYLKNTSASLSTLANVCGCLPINIEQNHEPYLIKLGFIEKKSGGRIITQKGMDYISK